MVTVWLDRWQSLVKRSNGVSNRPICGESKRNFLRNIVKVLGDTLGADAYGPVNGRPAARIKIRNPAVELTNRWK